MPFTQSKNATPSPHITPGNSYTQTGYQGSQSCNAYLANGYAGRKEDGASAKSYGQPSIGGYGNTGGMGMDRPLPPRSGPGYGHRPRSIDLVTPFSGH